MMASSDGGISGAGTSARMGTGALYMCWVRIPMKLSASKGTLPVTISYSETPTEYLQRIFVMSGAAAPPARALTGLFERARYSDRPVDEAMRSEAIAALGSLRQGLLAGAVG